MKALPRLCCSFIGALSAKPLLCGHQAVQPNSSFTSTAALLIEFTTFMQGLQVAQVAISYGLLRAVFTFVLLH